MRNKINILILLFILSSCNTKDFDGIWLSENKDLYSFTLANFSNDSLTIKYLSSFNYHLSNDPLLLKKQNLNTYTNDSIRVNIELTDSLEMEIYVNNNKVQVETFHELRQFKPEIDIDSFKHEIQEKTLTYEMENYAATIDLIDSIRAYNHSIKRTPIGLDYYDIFEIGNEIFIILHTDNPLPIQIIKSNTVYDKKSYTSILLNEEGTLRINSRQNVDRSITGKWKLKDLNNDKENTIQSVIITLDSFIVNRLNKSQDGFEINKLSVDSLYFLKSSVARPYLISIEMKDEGDMIVTNHRYGKDVEMNLIKEYKSIVR